MTRKIRNRMFQAEGSRTMSKVEANGTHVSSGAIVGVSPRRTIREQGEGQLIEHLTYQFSNY